MKMKKSGTGTGTAELGSAHVKKNGGSFVPAPVPVPDSALHSLRRGVKLPAREAAARRGARMAAVAHLEGPRAGGGGALEAAREHAAVDRAPALLVIAGLEQDGGA